MTGNILHKDRVDPDANLQEFRNRNTYKHQTVLCNGVLSASIILYFRCEMVLKEKTIMLATH